MLNAGNKQAVTYSNRKKAHTHWIITHHHVIGFWDIYFKLKPPTLVVTLIWKGNIKTEKEDYI